MKCQYMILDRETISVGDTKEEVDEALGTPKEEMNYSEYEDNLSYYIPK